MPWLVSLSAAGFCYFFFISLANAEVGQANCNNSITLKKIGKNISTECFHIDSYISGARIRICDAIEKGGGNFQ